MSRERDRTRWILVGSALGTAALWMVPYGHWLGYPLFLLSTLAHELGHGVTAEILGGDFLALLMWPDGSGVAQWRGSFGRAALAAVAAGGLLGPAMGAAVLFLTGSRRRPARSTLVTLGALLVLVDLVLVRNLFGFLFVGAIAAACLAIGLKSSAEVAQVTVLFLGTQLALAVFSRADYLFTDEALTAAGPGPSDVAVMARALWFPFWFWGAACGLLSLGVLGWGLARAWND